MHHALLIDEVLQVIFDFCSEDTGPTFARLARCCRAWRDPALDRLWARMNGVEPLLALLPKDFDENVNSCQPFSVYASRVRQILYNKNPLIPANIQGGLIFPALEDVNLAFEGCRVPPAWATAPRLKRVRVNIGFARPSQDVLDRSNAVAAYLQHASAAAPGLHTIQVRGCMSDALNASIASLSHLRSLTIQGNCFLDCKTLAAIAAFPNLHVLDAHASHIRAEEFDAALSRPADESESPLFPSLRELTLRTTGPLLAAVLARLPVGTLTKLHVDLESCAQGPAYMKSIFELLAQKASGSLRELTVEDRTELDELDTEADLHPNTPRWYTLDTLGPLARLKQLRRFALRDPDVADADLALLGKWWPQLQHLNLGTRDADAELPPGKVQLGPAAYAVVAQSFANLESLVLPAVPPSVLEGLGAVAPNKVLRSLTLGLDVPPDAASVHAVSCVVDTLLTLFPSMTTLECERADISARFEASGSVTH